MIHLDDRLVHERIKAFRADAEAFRLIKKSRVEKALFDRARAIAGTYPRRASRRQLATEYR
ncbi:MAG: hypothetical protein JSV66_04890 [Trueperaceae bacterium]|nr:MAG: hypothetical protein JSV66_04890 [Trueperaceae bacterium]